MTNYTKDTLDMIPGETPREKYKNLKEILSLSDKSWMHDDDEKTSLEWFEIAKYKNVSWADIAMAAFDGEIYKVGSLKEAVMTGITWGKTKQGYVFWETIYNSL